MVFVMIKLEKWEEQFKKKPIWLCVKIICVLFFLGSFIITIGYGLSWFGEVAIVAKQEFGAKAMLKKYEWFKDASAQLDKKLEDIEIYKFRTNSMEKIYSDISRKDWDRDDKKQNNHWL